MLPCKVNDKFVHFQDISSNKHHIYAKCGYLRSPINLIVICANVTVLMYTDFI